MNNDLSLYRAGQLQWNLDQIRYALVTGKTERDVPIGPQDRIAMQAIVSRILAEFERRNQQGVME